MSDIYVFDNIGKYYLARNRGIIDSLLRVPKIYVKALDGVSIRVPTGKVLAVVGESGSGKTTLGKVAVTLEDATMGTMTFDGTVVNKKEYHKIRQRVDMIFQNPSTSLNPKMKIKDVIIESLMSLSGEEKKKNIAEAKEKKISYEKLLEEKAAEAIELVGLTYAEVKNKQAREMSGGQVQRIAVARSIVKHPELLVLDEPTSALDESIQAQVLNLLVDIQERFNLTYIFITHNILVAKYISDVIIVMYAGKVVEYGSTESVLSKPLHPYTQLLLSSVPTTDKKDVVPPVGDVPSLINLPSGCRFHPRCPFVMEKCKIDEPPLLKNGTNEVACWLYE